MLELLCKCGQPRRASGRYCPKCHAAYMRGWRKRTGRGFTPELEPQSHDDEAAVIAVALHDLDGVAA